MNILQRRQLVEDLWCLQGASFVSFVAKTIPQLKGGKKNPLDGMVKVAYVKGTINWVYKNAVDRQRGIEETPLNEKGELIGFEPDPRKWGLRLHDALMKTTRGTNRLTPLVAHPCKSGTITLEQLRLIPVDQLYLELLPGQSLEYHYFLNNQEIDADTANAAIYEKPESSRQGVKKKILLRDYKVTNIQQITFNGQTWMLAGR